MLKSINFITQENVALLRDGLASNIQMLRGLKFAILDSYVSEEMIFFKKNVPYEKLEISSICAGFDELELDYQVIDPSVPNFERLLENIDFAFLNLYGEWGEDGRVQGLLDYLKIDYNGSGVIGSALFIDKILAKIIVRSQGHLTANFDSIRLSVKDSLRLPVMVKTYRGGTSVRMQYIDSEIPVQIEEDCFMEDFIEGRLLTVSIIEKGGDIFILPALEIVSDGSKFYDDQSKANRTTTYNFPLLNDSTRQQIFNLVRDSYNLMDLRNYGRLDLILNGDDIYFLETNTVPGFSKVGNYALSFKHVGIDFPELLGMVMTSALEKKVY